MSNDPIKVTYTDLADLKGQVLNLASAFDNADGASITPTRTATGSPSTTTPPGTAWRTRAGRIRAIRFDFSALDSAGSDLTVTLS